MTIFAEKFHIHCSGLGCLPCSIPMASHTATRTAATLPVMAQTLAGGVWVGDCKETVLPAGTADTQPTKDSTPDYSAAEIAVILDTGVSEALSDRSDISENTGRPSRSSVTGNTDPPGDDTSTSPLCPSPELPWLTGVTGTDKGKQSTSPTRGNDSMAGRAAPARDDPLLPWLPLWLVDFLLLHDFLQVLPKSFPLGTTCQVSPSEAVSLLSF